MTRLAHFTKIAFASAFVICGMGAIAQSQEAVPQVTVEAWKVVVTEVRSAPGGPTEKVQIARQVDFAGLDLTTSAGAKELEARVNKEAEAVCKEIQNLFPERASGSGVKGFRLESCVKSAVDGAAPQLKVAIAAAKDRSARAAQGQK